MRGVHDRPPHAEHARGSSQQQPPLVPSGMFRHRCWCVGRRSAAWRKLVSMKMCHVALCACLLWSLASTLRRAFSSLHLVRTKRRSNTGPAARGMQGPLVRLPRLASARARRACASAPFARDLREERGPAPTNRGRAQGLRETGTQTWPALELRVGRANEPTY